MNIKSNNISADIGIFGGSGFYDLLKNVKEIEIKTPYGLPSDKIAVGEYHGKKIAFLPRHGKKHIFPPHKIPYTANLWAFKSLGVKKIIAPSASGSLNINIKPGDFVICDQFVDRTKKRIDTFYEKDKVAHIPAANPYCPSLRKTAINACGHLKGEKIKCHKKGTVVVIEGPRFSTTAESLWFQNNKWDVINMTQYPENILARELEMCYVNISLITDYDAGMLGNKKINPHTNSSIMQSARSNAKVGVGVKAVDLKEVIKVFNENNEKVKSVIFEMIENIDLNSPCSCESAMRDAFF